MMKLRFSELYERRRWRVVLCLITAVVVLGLDHFDVLRAFEYRLYDYRVKLHATYRGESSPKIVIIAIDEESLARLDPHVGRWPWPRVLLASLLDYCSEADVIGVDIIFPERQLSRDDKAYADAVGQHGKVVTAVHFHNTKGSPMPETGHRFALTEPGPENERELRSYRHALAPFPELMASTRHIGSISHTHDTDGVLRGYAAAVSSDGRVYPSLPLAMALLHQDLTLADVKLATDHITVGDTRISANAAARFQLNPHKTTPYEVVSAADVLQSWQAEDQRDGDLAVRRDFFKDKLVLLGSMATGLERDQVNMSLAPEMHGVIVNAIALDNILSGRVMHQSKPWVTLILVLLLSILPALPRTERPSAVLLISLAMVAAVTSAIIITALGFRLMLPASAPLLALLLACGTVVLLNWIRERVIRRHLEELEKAKQQFTDMLVHDMKNRVGPIMMAMAMMEDTIAEEGDEYGLGMSLENARLSTERLLMEMKSLLDIRKMSEGRMSLDQRMTPLEKLIEQAMSDMSPAATNLDLSLAVKKDADGVQIDVDRHIINRILVNLIWNAIDHSPPGSEIELGYSDNGDGTVTIYVANHGPVISTDMRESIFEAYVTGERRAGNKQQSMSGTGLGLAFCRLGVEAHGGRIHIESPWSPHDDGVKVCLALGFTPKEAVVASV